ncbi:MAG: serine hydrolase domain-containing protein [Rhodanobacter sp.]
MPRLISVLLLVVLLTDAAAALKPEAAADARMAPYVGNVPGASLLVLKDGKPLVRRGYGRANLESGELVTPSTNYRLASVSKQFTAAAILLLAEDGKLRLDDPVRRWLPTLPETTQQVTLRQLLTHTGGLIDYEDLIPPGTTAQVSDDDVLRLLATAPDTYFAAGSAYRYSNTGYVLLGLVVERAAGTGLAQFLRQRIFAPLHMDNTLLYERGGPDVLHRAYGYSQAHGRWTRTDQSVTSATRGDGGIYSSIDDLAKWDAALYDDRLLSATSRQLAFTAHVKVSGEPYQAGYGYGWRITGDTLWHSGESIGFRNVIVRWPKQHLTVIILSNRNDPEPYHTALAIAEPFLDAP